MEQKTIDIFITAFLRQAYTEQTMRYLEERTKYPYRLFVINNGGNDEVIDEAIKQNKVFLAIKPSSNTGIHAAWNLALAMAESDYFITTDNDILVPDLRHKILKVEDGKLINQDTVEEQPCWLERLVKLMDERPDYGAISLHPHIFQGAAVIDHNLPDEVIERNMCGAVMRIMRRDAVWKVNGWEKVIRTSRNHEESTICSRLQSIGYKVGIATRLRAKHKFGKNWGYLETLDPHDHGHRRPGTEIWPPPEALDKDGQYDENTWLPL